MTSAESNWKLPILGFGTATANIGECSDALALALTKGFRMLDTATNYDNEEQIGIALRKWGGPREEVTICTKWGWSHDETYEHDPDAALEGSLKKIGVDHLDLYLIHGPFTHPFSREEAWQKMESYVEDGRVKSIGVSNFTADHIEELAKTWTIKPVVNEIEFHPYSVCDPQVQRTIATCEKYGISIGGYTCLASMTRFPGGPVDSVVEKIGIHEDCTPAQVLLAWARQRTKGGPIITTASKEYQYQYQDILDSLNLTLSDEDMDRIDRAGREGGVQRRYAIRVWGEGKPLGKL